MASRAGAAGVPGQRSEVRRRFPETSSLRGGCGALGMSLTIGKRYYWLFGLVNASPFFAAALIGTVLADPLSNGLRLGRRGVIAFAAVFCLLSVIGSAVSQTWYQLLVTRLLLGIGEL